MASIRYVGNAPEIESGSLLHQYIKDTKLYEIKPDFRHNGFNNPNGNMPNGNDHGFDFFG